MASSSNTWGVYLRWHLGGEQSPISNINGIRRSVVEALQQIRPPVIRWPGGCFADGYHWEDGIGPRDQRPVRVAKPWLNGNLGGGTPRELSEWVEYCNYAGDTAIARRRVENGAPQPLGVRSISGTSCWRPVRARRFCGRGGELLYIHFPKNSVSALLLPRRSQLPFIATIPLVTTYNQLMKE